MRQEAVQNDESGGERTWQRKVIPVERIPAKKAYRTLSLSPHSAYSRKLSRRFLLAQLDLSKSLGCDFPDEPEKLLDWVGTSAKEVADDYRQYLKDRKAGAPRRYFETRGQALSFIVKVAPTKLVDGAWLYGILEHWSDLRLQPLVETFLEELGSGDPDHNHVLLYKRLMAAEGCEQLDALDDKYYVQGAVQLALGYHATEFLPELIGYNLGYEQLPLHLLITAHELGELGMDPYYFTLHVTIDNASTGHARRAVQAMMESLPVEGDERKSFLRRVRRGYGLNDLGVGSMEIITSFDIEQEVIDILKHKSRFGLVHSDYCKIKGMTVNEWLADGEQIPRFLAALIEEGWIKRNQDPRDSRFWNLLQGPRAKMFGVFSPMERELIHEWIAGEWRSGGQEPLSRGSHSLLHGGERQKPLVQSAACVPIHGHTVTDDLPENRERKSDAGLRTTMDESPSQQMMRRLVELMAPGKHHTPEGLSATRMFCHLRNSNI